MPLSHPREAKPFALVRPAWLLLLGGLACLLLAVGAVALALQAPWIGLRLVPDEEADELRVLASRGPAAGVPPGATLVSIEAEGRAVTLGARDLIEEPDFFSTILEMHAFFERQSELSAILAAPELRLHLRSPGGTAQSSIVPSRGRPLSSLPFVFWVQLFSGSAAFLLGLWVLVLRPEDFPARMFALTGICLPFASHTAAVYSTRELALDGLLFRVLSDCNSVASVAFGAAFVALFLSYPRRLLRPRVLWALPALFLPWTALGLAGIIPSVDWGIRIPLLTMMSLALVFGVVQWRIGGNDPHARAALRWLGVSSLLGCSLFVFGVIGTRFLDLPPLSQGYSFAFFLLMDVGLAVGLHRHRLFALEGWAVRILLWVLGAISLLAVDAFLLLALQLDFTLSLGAALLVAGFVYFPVRNLLWSRLVIRSKVEEHDLFEGVLRVAFGATAEAREGAWLELLRRVFDPLEIRRSEASQEEGVRIAKEGLALRIPRVASLPAVELEHPWAGRGLFSPRHRSLAAHLVDLLRLAESSRGAYDRGVREERVRVARDLHDDLGARLLSSLHRENLEETREAVRRAIEEMRSVVGQLSGRPLSFDEMIAELRHETGDRLGAAGVTLDWPIQEGALPEPTHPQALGACVAIVREAISNVIRHAKAGRVRVAIEAVRGSIRLQVEDDGVGIADGARLGFGLTNMKRRGTEAAGTLEVASGSGGTVVTLVLPAEAAPAVRQRGGVS